MRRRNWHFRIEWKEYGLMTIGSLLTALSINIFLAPYNISPGGVSGLSLVLHYISGGRTPLGTTIFLINVPLFILAYRILGVRSTVRALYSTVLLSGVIDLTFNPIRYYTGLLLAKEGHTVASADLFLYTVVGGFILGTGLGLVLKAGGSTGGSDLAALLINHIKPHYPVGQVILVIETLILIFTVIAFHSILLGLYALVSLYIQSKVIDSLLEGVNFAKMVFIISNHSDEISQGILQQLDRGVTALKGIGMYTGTDKNILMCILHRSQLAELKKIVAAADKNAFVILADIREVLGEGFKNY